MRWVAGTAMVVGLGLLGAGTWFRLTLDRSAASALPKRSKPRAQMSYAEKAQYRYELRSYFASRYGAPALVGGAILLVVGAIGNRLAE